MRDKAGSPFLCRRFRGLFCRCSPARGLGGEYSNPASFSAGGQFYGKFWGPRHCRSHRLGHGAPVPCSEPTADAQAWSPHALSPVRLRDQVREPLACTAELRRSGREREWRAQGRRCHSEMTPAWGPFLPAVLPVGRAARPWVDDGRVSGGEVPPDVCSAAHRAAKVRDTKLTVASTLIFGNLLFLQFQIHSQASGHGVTHPRPDRPKEREAGRGRSQHSLPVLLWHSVRVLAASQLLPGVGCGQSALGPGPPCSSRCLQPTRGMPGGSPRALLHAVLGLQVHSVRGHSP